MIHPVYYIDDPLLNKWDKQRTDYQQMTWGILPPFTLTRKFKRTQRTINMIRSLVWRRVFKLLRIPKEDETIYTIYHVERVDHYKKGVIVKFFIVGKSLTTNKELHKLEDK